LKSFLKKLFNLFEKPLPYFFTFHLRPKRADKIGTVADKSLKYSKVAIVIQGPIVYDEDFTLETIKLYKKIFPEAIIILSTWDYEKTEYVDKIKNEGIEIILNKPPVVKGAQNVNFQLISAFVGIKKAGQLGAEYVCKTRTDQRIYNPNALVFLSNIVEKFPVVGDYKQKKRIVGVSLNTFKYRLYGVSDMNLFGNVDDILNYFSAEPDEEGKNLKKVSASYPEVYLSVSYLQKIGRQLLWTLRDSWRVLAEHFIIVDEKSLDLYWYKYARMKEFRYLRYGEASNDRELTFCDWFNIHANLENIQEPDLNKMKKKIA